MNTAALRKQILKDYKEYAATASRLREEPTVRDFYTFAGLKHDILRLPGDPEQELLNDPERDHGQVETQN